MEKVIKGLREISDYFFNMYRLSTESYETAKAKDRCDIIEDAIYMLKEREEREKGICKEICDLIRGSCSTDTDADNEYVCHMIQQCFIGWAVKRDG